MNNCEILASITDNECTVSLKGATSDLVSCLCGTIKALSKKILDNIKFKYENNFGSFLTEVGLDEDTLQEYVISVLVAQIMETLDIVRDADVDEPMNDSSNIESLNYAAFENIIQNNGGLDSHEHTGN